MAALARRMLRSSRCAMSSCAAAAAKEIADSGKQSGIKFYQFSFLDLFGVQRSKLVPASRVEEIAEGGAGFAKLGLTNPASLLHSASLLASSSEGTVDKKGRATFLKTTMSLGISPVLDLLQFCVQLVCVERWWAFSQAAPGGF